MEKRLQGKVALVTGGTSGIGAGAVRRLRAEGAQVAFTGSNTEAAERITRETGASFHPHRVEAEATWPALVDTLRSRYGRLDIAFANAGSEAGDGSIESIPFEAWNRLVAVNLTGV